MAAAVNGDVIEIDAAGNYAGNVCAISKSNLTLRGVGGRAKIDAAGNSSGGKAIWVISGNDTVIENIELSGAKVVDKNGAGIRQEGTNLTVRNCYFHDNENGILAGDKAGSTITIEYTEFANNGAGDGQSHNLYINHVSKLVFRHNYSHHAKVGHLLKTRAAENHILYNRLTGEDGTNSYEVDVPNGGKTILVGNLIQQGPNTGNGGIVAYRLEGAHASNPSTALFAVNNTIVNDRTSGGTFFNISSGVSTPAVLRNNIFVGVGTVINQSTAVKAGNFQGDPMFVNKAGFDYHLKLGSPAVDKGVAPGMADTFDLTPKYHYVHPAGVIGRAAVGVIDVGAYELNGNVSSVQSGSTGPGDGEGGLAAVDAAAVPSAAATTRAAAAAAVVGSDLGAGAGWLASAALASIVALRRTRKSGARRSA
ncbi:right-handed parallel beta-helix repeat-containing protein [Polyangium aurulentum]|uniref:right-handed parallel beta-helix repeat-containing protein n=1 Tax=Polyangium aurulentum TaxID=2567896 RepID=UPI00200F6C50|nr:right-handed parallel beta-helix repeat-containing protein [Polyangium aurulentum]UQA55206.1 right-handed parallel beta-helix repeat-containing protein [Polyangium aurulentum]